MLPSIDSSGNYTSQHPSQNQGRKQINKIEMFRALWWVKVFTALHVYVLVFTALHVYV